MNHISLNETPAKKLGLIVRVKRSIKLFSITERVIFSTFALIALFSALFILQSINKSFTVEVPVKGGTLNEGIIGYARYINPILNYTDADRDLSSLIYSGLVKATPEGKIESDLAKSWNISDDGKIYDIILKDNIYFQDNTPVTADDVEFTVLKAQDVTIKSPKEANWDGVTTEVVSPKEIKFTLKTAYAPFLENLTLGILPKHIWKDVDPMFFDKSSFNENPIGSGPYKIKSVGQNSSGINDYYHLVPFEKYVSGSPYIANLIIKSFRNEADLVSAYKSGQIQSLGGISTESAIQIINSGNKAETTPLPRSFAIFFNQNTAQVFLNKEVRQALSVATDKQAIINTVFNGYAVQLDGPIPAQLLNSEEIKGADEGILNSTSTLNTDNIGKAKKILTDNGWKLNANGVMEKKTTKGKVVTTQQLAFSISTSNTPDLKQTAEILKEQWTAIGAAVDLKIFEPADLNQMVIRPRKYDTLLFGTVTGRDLDLYAFWHSSQRNDPGLNVAMYANPKVDKLLEDARTLSDKQQRIDKYNQVADAIQNDIPAIFLYSPEYIYITPNSIKGIDLKQITTAAERFLNINSWYMETEDVWKIFIKN